MRMPSATALAHADQRDRVAGTSRLAHHRPQELLLAHDAAEVTGGIGLLLTVDDLDVVPGAHVGQRLVPSRSTGPA